MFVGKNTFSSWVFGLLLTVSSVAAVSGDLRLVDAAKNRDADSVRALLRQRADVNTRQADGATALHWAAHWNDAEIANLLIRAGANVNSANDFGITPLSLACTNGNASIVEALLTAGAEANTARPTGETPLMTCSRSGSLDAVRLLLARGAQVNAKERAQGQTALMWAAAENNVDVMRVLIERGAEIGARTTKVGFTPLLFAAREGAVDAVGLLLANGANVNDRASDGTSVLVTATYRGAWDLAERLLDEGADPNSDGAGYTALHWAAGAWENTFTGVLGSDKYQRLGGRGPGKLELVKALLSHGANPNARMKKVPPRFGSTVAGNSTPSLLGATPFALAALGGDIGIMRTLLTVGADPRLSSDNGTTPLMTAAGFGRVLGESRSTEEDALQAVKLALELGNDINGANQGGETALHAAAYNGWDSIVQFLADNGASVNARNVTGATPLVLAEGYIGPGACTITWPNTAALLRKLGGVNTLDFVAVIASREECPNPRIDVINPDGGNEYRSKLLFVKTGASTQYVGGSCVDLRAATKIRITGTRPIGKGWDGSVDASRIQVEH